MSTHPDPRFPRPFACLTRFAAGAALVAASATGQCANAWATGASVAGLSSAAIAIELWDPDGAGPATPLVVMGGEFLFASSQIVNRITTYDPLTGAFAPLGTGMTEAMGSLSNVVTSLAALANGDLVAAGTFTMAGGTPVDRIARWDGTAWHALGSGLSGTLTGNGPRVQDLLVLPNGDLIVVGDFAFAGGLPVNGAARWDGTSWWPLWFTGNGVPYCVAQMPNGDLVVGGSFVLPAGGGAPAAFNTARWDGVSWSTMTPNGMLGAIQTLKVLGNGDLVAGGPFTLIDGVPAHKVARWDGSAWHSMGFGATTLPYSSINAIEQTTNGDVVVAGTFDTSGGVPMNHLARWNGTTWSPLGAGASNTATSVRVLPNGELLAGGTWATIGGTYATGVASWDGVAWSAMAPAHGFTGTVEVLAHTGPSEMVAGGTFAWVDGQPVSRVARWDGAAWGPLGAGVNDTVTAAASFQGDVYVGGSFYEAGGLTALRVARWDGSSWSPLGSGTSGSVFALAGSPTALVVGGQFGTAGGLTVNNIAQWDGASWSPLGSGVSSRVSALLWLRNGDLLASGSFITAGGVTVNRIARWDGASWSPLGSGCGNSVNAMIELPNGDIVVGGAFSTAGGVPADRVARWDGTAWSPVGSGLGGIVYSLVALPNGDIVAGGSFTNVHGNQVQRIARWDGSAWTEVAGGVNGRVNALLLAPDAVELLVGGLISTAGGMLTLALARLQTSCPAATSTTGAGCAGPGSSNVLTSTSLPWAGSVLAVRGTGLPAPAIALAVTGFAPTSLPLANVLPQALAGCTLHAMPDLVDALVSTGTVDYGIALPNTAAVAGVVLHQQMVVLELDAQLNLSTVTVTNALQHTVGFF